MICGSIDRFAKDSLREKHVVGNNSGREMVRNRFEHFEDIIDLRVSVLGHNLEGSEKLSRQQLPLLSSPEVFEGNKDGSGFEGAVTFWNLVIFERIAAKEDFSSLKFENGIQMLLDSLVVPG